MREMEKCPLCRFHRITKEKLAELIRRDQKLSALEAGGVDNWEWYGESLKEFWQDDDDEQEDVDANS